LRNPKDPIRRFSLILSVFVTVFTVEIESEDIGFGQPRQVPDITFDRTFDMPFQPFDSTPAVFAWQQRPDGSTAGGEPQL